MAKVITPIPGSELDRTTLKATQTELTDVINFISSGVADIMAKFSATHINNLLDENDCHGIRLRPGINNGDGVVVAVCVDSLKQDLTDGYPCYFGNSQGQVYTYPIANMTDLTVGSVADPLLADQLNVVFEKSYLEGLTYDTLEFEVATIDFADGEPDVRTIILSRLNNDVNIPDEFVVSWLPCPPNCGNPYDSKED